MTLTVILSSTCHMGEHSLTQNISGNSCLPQSKSGAQDIPIARTTSVYTPCKVEKVNIEVTILLHPNTIQLVQNVKSNYTNWMIFNGMLVALGTFM